MEQFDYRIAYAFCRVQGLIVAALWSASFLMAMYGSQAPVLGNLSMLVGLMSVLLAGRQLRVYRLAIAPLTYRRAWWMSIVTNGLAVLVVALVQYLYFRFLDHGHLCQTCLDLMNIPEYQKLIEQTSNGMPVKEVKEQLTTLFTNPAQLTMMFLWYNLTLGLILSIPQALIGITGKSRKSE